MCWPRPLSTRPEMEAAKDLLKRAVELDTAKRYSEALICYEEGIQNLLRSMHGSKAGDEVVVEMRRKAEGYLKRAEQVKKLVKAGEDLREKVQSITISEGATGYSYDEVLSEYLDGTVLSIVVEDPYIRARHQIHNMVRFCELAVRRCKNLQTLELHTGGGEPDQQQQLGELAGSLQRHGVALTVTYSHTLHDRQIRLSNGWVIKLGRGLDYFKRPEGQFTIGFSDYSLRACHETTIEIYHKLNTKRLKQTTPTDKIS